MKNSGKFRKSLVCAAVCAVLCVTGCGSSADSSAGKSDTNSKSASTTALDKNNPVTVVVWNYYNGDQLSAFEKLVEEFNSSVGIDKGVVVSSVSQGDISTLADSLIDAVDGKAGAQEIPALAAVYSETGFILNEKSALIPMDSYFTEDELSAYIPQFIDSGRFDANNDLMLFPISKSTELFTANTTDWQAFADATGVTIDSIQTKEDLTSAAEKYYEWTDGLTPDVAEDGKALYGRDSMGNYMYVGSYSLGHELFKVEDGKLTVDLDKDTFRTLWDNYYVPYINGYFGSYSKFRSEDAKTGKILSLTSSSSSVSYLPSEVVLEDDSTHEIDIEIRPELKFANAVNDAVVEQGASYCLLKTTEAQQEGAVEFLKWFTETDRNMDFALMSEYSPVTKDANNVEAIKTSFGDNPEVSAYTQDALVASAEMFSGSTPYETKPFEGGKDVRSLLESSMQTIADTDRASVVAAIADGKSRADAVAEFDTDEHFEEWFTDLSSQIEKLTGTK